jgi:hypothetical protein
LLVTDLERFFRQIVRNLAASDPARLHRPLPLSDLRESIIPYRANRRALQLESSEDYELLVMQLCAGEGGFAKTEPEDVRALFVEELRGSNPDLGILQLHGNAVVILDTKAVAEALDRKPELAFAPPVDSVESGPAALPEPPFPEPLDGAMPVALAANANQFLSHCALCGGVLPTGRAISFCPHCGGQHMPARCSACRGEIEPGWRHCITCGAAVTR